MAWYPVDTGLFLSGGRDGDVKVWDTNTLQVGCVFGVQAAVHSVAMSPAAATHCLAAVGSAENDVMLCDVVSGGCTHRLSMHGMPVWALAWSPACEFELISGGRDGELVVWDIRRAGPRHVFNLRHTRPLVGAARDGGIPGGTAYSRMDMAPAHDAGITGIAATPDGQFYLSAGNDDFLRLWHSRNRQNMLVNYRNVYNRASKPRQLALSDDGAAVFHPSGSAVQAFDVQTGAPLATLKGGHFESVNCCVWNPLSSELYTGGNDNHIVVWAPRVWGAGPGGADDSDRDAWSD